MFNGKALRVVAKEYEIRFIINQGIGIKHTVHSGHARENAHGLSHALIYAAHQRSHRLSLAKHQVSLAALGHRGEASL